PPLVRKLVAGPFFTPLYRRLAYYTRALANLPSRGEGRARPSLRSEKYRLFRSSAPINSTCENPAPFSSTSAPSGEKNNLNGSPAAATREASASNTLRARGPSNSGEMAKSNVTAVGLGSPAIVLSVDRNASNDR